MSGLVTREVTPGLLVAEHGVGEARLQHDLEEIDPRFVLQKHPGEVAGGWVYKVFQIVSDDQPAICVFTWADAYGNPLPLSSGLVEEFKKWLPEARARRGPNADEYNAALQEERRRDQQAQTDAILGEHRARIEKGRVTVGMSTRQRNRYGRRARPAR